MTQCDKMDMLRREMTAAAIPNNSKELEALCKAWKKLKLAMVPYEDAHRDNLKTFSRRARLNSRAVLW